MGAGNKIQQGDEMKSKDKWKVVKQIPYCVFWNLSSGYKQKHCFHYKYPLHGET